MDEDTQLTISYRDLQDFTRDTSDRAFAAGLLLGVVAGAVFGFLCFFTL